MNKDGKNIKMQTLAGSTFTQNISKCGPFLKCDFMNIIHRRLYLYLEEHIFFHTDEILLLNREKGITDRAQI